MCLMGNLFISVSASPQMAGDGTFHKNLKAETLFDRWFSSPIIYSYIIHMIV